MMIKKNGNEYEKLMNADPHEVVANVREEMKQLWEKTGGYDYYILRPDGMRYAIFPRGGGGQRHTIFLDAHCCTCGYWQEHSLPCIHLVVYLRQCRIFERFEDFLDCVFIDDIYRKRRCSIVTEKT